MLKIKNLSVSFSSSGTTPAVQDVSFDVPEGKTTVMIGETGSGKSVLLLAVLRLLPPTAGVAGEILLDGKDILALSMEDIIKLRGSRISYVPQGGGGGMNPLIQIGFQVGEPLMEHKGYTKKEAIAASVGLLKRFQLGEEEKIKEKVEKAKPEDYATSGVYIENIEVSPSQILSEQEIKEITDQYIQRNLTFENLQELINQINKLYLKKGYVTANSLNSIFEDESLTSEDIDEIYNFLKEKDIEIVSADLNEIEEVKPKKKTKIDLAPIKTLDERKDDLLKMGKTNGFLTFEQLANSLKGLEMDAESLDDLYNFLRDNNIEVVEDETEVGGGDDLLDISDLDFDESTLNNKFYNF